MNDIDIDVNVTAWKIGPVIILQAHPAPPQPKQPEFLEPRYAPEKPAGIGDNRRES